MQPVIELDNLEVRFGDRTILKKLNGSFTGRAIGLLGPNGAGKSTLLNTLLGFHQPSAGTARVMGHDVRTEARQIRALIGYMPENDCFISNMPAKIDGTEYQQVMRASRTNCTKKRGIHTLWSGTSTQVAPHHAMLKISKVERSKLRGDGQAMRSVEQR